MVAAVAQRRRVEDVRRERRRPVDALEKNPETPSQPPRLLPKIRPKPTTQVKSDAIARSESLTAATLDRVLGAHHPGVEDGEARLRG
jgi:hypothetical protein